MTVQNLATSMQKKFSFSIANIAKLSAFLCLSCSLVAFAAPPSPPSLLVARNAGPFQDLLIHKQQCLDISNARKQVVGNTHVVSPAAPGLVNYNGSQRSLRSVVQGAAAGDTILLENGIYQFSPSQNGSYTGLYVTKNDITIRSASGNPNAVVLDSNYLELGNESALITVAASGFSLQDLTLTRAVYHLLHVHGAASNLKVHNVHFLDGGQQFLKASASDSSARIDNGEISCSVFEMTENGRRNIWGYGSTTGYTRCYTGGIDAHRATNWQIRDNRFEGIYCDTDEPHPAHGLNSQPYYGGLAEHAIHMWHSADNSTHLIERNEIRNCARGIGIGTGNNPQPGAAIIRNNMISSSFAGAVEHDVGIIIEAVSDAKILANTVVFTHPNAYSSGIEYRFGATQATITNNLLSNNIRLRDGASGVVQGNQTNVPLSAFVDSASGDLHLQDCSLYENAGINLGADVEDDFDSDDRRSQFSVGADVCP